MEYTNPYYVFFCYLTKEQTKELTYNGIGRIKYGNDNFEGSSPDIFRRKKMQEFYEGDLIDDQTRRNLLR